MYWNRQVWVDQSEQLQPLLRVHGNHQQGRRRRRNGSAPKVDEHEVNVLSSVAFWNLFELVEHECVAGNVNPVLVSRVGL